jgi:hypothetical protein
MLSPLEFETGTLRTAGANLAASRLASIKMNMITTASRPKRPNQPVSTEAGEVQLAVRCSPCTCGVRQKVRQKSARIAHELPNDEQAFAASGTKPLQMHTN